MPQGYVLDLFQQGIARQPQSRQTYVNPTAQIRMPYMPRGQQPMQQFQQPPPPPGQQQQQPQVPQQKPPPQGSQQPLAQPYPQLVSVFTILIKRA